MGRDLLSICIARWCQEECNKISYLGVLGAQSYFSFSLEFSWKIKFCFLVFTFSKKNYEVFRPKSAREVSSLKHRKLQKQKLRGRKLWGHSVLAFKEQQHSGLGIYRPFSKHISFMIFEFTVQIDPKLVFHLDLRVLEFILSKSLKSF